MSIFMTPISYCSVKSIQYNKARKNKSTKIRKEEIILFEDNAIVCSENLKEYTKKLLHLVNQLIQVAVHKVNTKKFF